VKLLLCRNNIEVDSGDSFGRTPLLWAAENGHKAVMELLQNQQGVQISLKDQNG
jgi:ankyrin repeat protein